MTGIEGLASSRSLFAAYQRALRVDPLFSFIEWTEEHGRNPDGSRFKFWNYQLAPASDLFNDAFEYVALRWFSGGGKTYLTAMAYCYGIDQLKLNFAKIFPAMDEAKEWFEDELMPILRATPRIARIRMNKDNAFLKRWVTGASVKGRGFRSPGGLRTLKVEVVDCDEIDAIDRTKKDEGNPLTIAEARTRGRRFQAHWRTSYPSVVGESQIDNSIDRSDSCKWWYPCPRCGAEVHWERSHIIWTPGKVESAEVKCPECDRTFSDSERLESCRDAGHYKNRDGERVDPGSAPSPKYGNRRGYHLNCMAFQGLCDGAYPNYLAELASKQEAAMAADDPDGELQVLRNTRDAMSYSSLIAETPDPSELEDSREHWDGEMLPEDCVAIYLGMDPNQSFQAIQIIGVGQNEVYPLLYEKVHGWWERPSTWARVKDLMRKRWRHPLGVEIKVSIGCWDSKFQPDTVYKHARGLAARVICTKGSPTSGAPPIGTIGRMTTGVRKMPTGPNELKAIVYDWVSPPKSDAATGANVRVRWTDVEDADGLAMFDGAYFEGLLIEERTAKLYNGRLVPIFTHSNRDIRNEPLDTFGLCVAAMKADRFDYARKREHLEARAALAKGDKPKPAPQFVEGFGR